MPNKLCPYCKPDNISSRSCSHSFCNSPTCDKGNEYYEKYDCWNCNSEIDEKDLLDKPNIKHNSISTKEYSCGCTDYSDRGFSNGCRCYKH